MARLSDLILSLVHQEFQKEEPQWHITSLSAKDMAFLTKECNTASEFDPLGKRIEMYTKMRRGIAECITYTCPYGQICVIADHSRQKKEIPWGLWGRILRLFSEKAHPTFKIFFLAHPHGRHFPESAQEVIGPQHINGGYTQRCNRETVVIYRAEDATRVMIHELMHSCCLDDHSTGVDLVEAETEAWAEVMYVGLLSRGNRALFDQLLQKQSDWIQCQDDRVRRHMTVPMQFPWRYTIGKEEVWRRWNMLLPRSSPIVPCTSLRLTAPPDAKLKGQFGVAATSTIL
jgi:hypothetical protein